MAAWCLSSRSLSATAELTAAASRVGHGAFIWATKGSGFRFQVSGVSGACEEFRGRAAFID